MTPSEIERECNELQALMTRQILDSAWQRNNPLTTAYTGPRNPLIDPPKVKLSQAELDSILEWRDLGNGKAARRLDAPIGGTRQGVAWLPTQAGSVGVDLARDNDRLGIGVYHSPESLGQIRAAATEAERARIIAVLETCRPTTQPYSRRDWAIEEKGKRDLFAKIMKALGVTE